MLEEGWDYSHWNMQKITASVRNEFPELIETRKHEFAAIVIKVRMPTDIFGMCFPRPFTQI